MTRAEIERFRNQLLKLHERMARDVSQLSNEALRQTGGEASGSLSNTPLHTADLGSDSFAEEVTLGMLENEQQVLLEVGEALGRITRGTFGRCERCQEEIARDRLQALAYARHCLKCTQELETPEGFT
jgi:RNA polymerase-binding transcription factor DksA